MRRKIDVLQPAPPPTRTTSRKGVERWRRIVRRRLAGRAEPDSLRMRLLVATAVAMAPLVIFGTVLSLHQARDAGGLVGLVSWITVAALPILFGFAGCLLISLAAEAWILRWLVYFERVSKAYAHGRYGVRPRNVAQAPSEFRALGAAVEEMAGAVQERDTAVRRALDQQTMVLREVHHRVKNNLQIVGSLLSLQAARTTSPEARDALLDALVRIDAMALGQRFLQDDGEGGSVSLTQLFQAWSSQIRARLTNGPRRLVLRMEVAERELGMDLAAPLVLIATEAVMQAYRRATTDPLVCRLRLNVSDAAAVKLVLSVDDDPHAFARDAGVSKTLMQGYLRQIHGGLTVGETADVLTVEAPLAA